MVFLGAFVLVFTLFLVGHLFYRALAPADEAGALAEVLLVQVLGGFLFCGWVALLLAQLGLFSLPRLVGVLLFGAAAVVAIRWRQVRRWRWPRARVTREGLLALGIFVLLAAFLVYPGEWLLGGQDPAVYVAIGASIARTGGIVVQDPWIASLPTEARSLVLSYFLDQWWHVPGFYVSDFAAGQVTPQFLHLYPTWLAVFFAAGGLDLSLAATALITLLGLGAFFLLLRRTFNTCVATMATALLGLVPAQVWFARQPTAEALTMTLLFAGWYLLDRSAYEPARRDLAVLAGLALGQIALTKIEFLFLPLLLYGYFALRALVSPLRPSDRSFLAAHTVMIGHAAAHLVLFSPPYLQTLFTSLEQSGLPSSPAAVAIALGLLGLLAVLLLGFRRQIRRFVVGMDARPHLLRRVLCGLWLLVVFGAAVLLPVFSPAAVDVQGSRGPNLERLSFLRLAWYLSPIGLALAVAGVAWWLLHRLQGPSLVFVAAFLVQQTLYSFRTLAYPYHFWMMRRYIPIVLPCLVLGIAVALWRVRMAPLGRSVRRGGAMVLLGLLLVLIVRADLPFASRRELAGTQEVLSRLAHGVPDDVPLYVEHFGAGLVTPLRYIYGKPAYLLPTQASSDDPAGPQSVPWEALWPLLLEWPPGVESAYLLLEKLPAVLYGGTLLAEEGPFLLETWATEQTWEHLPRDAAWVRSAQSLFRLQRRPDDPNRVEVSLVTPVWTGPCIALKLPSAAGAMRLRLRAAGFRPEPLPAARLELVWQGEVVGEIALARSWEFREVVIDLARVVGEGKLQICTDAWNPKDYGYGDQPAELGILLGSLVLEDGFRH